VPLGRDRLGRARDALSTRTELWRDVGLGAEVDRGQAQRAQGMTLVLLAALVGVLVVFDHRDQLFPGLGQPVRVLTVVALVILGWALVRSAGRGIAPALFRRLDPATAGTVGFLIRLFTIMLVVVLALRVAGVKTETLAVGGAFTAVVVGLAAQQTIGNLIAGLVLLSARPFRVGERVRFVGGALAGDLEGIVGSLGLLHTSLVSGADRILVPNSMILDVAVIPIREPERVELRARFSSETTPRDVEMRLRDEISTPMRYPPHIALEELDRDEVVVRIVAVPQTPTDGARLADEVLSALRRNGAAATARG
jgi:small conductance mechanosensitive channel